MKRVLQVLVGVALVVGAVLVLRPDASVPVATAPAVLTTARLGVVPAPAEPEPPTARYTRTVLGPTDAAGMNPLLDRCDGPVAIDLGDDVPTLVAEHDYCGGSAWMWKLRPGDAVELGGGVDADTYVVTSMSNAPRRQATVDDLPTDASLVLQTCVSPSEIVLLGLVPHDQVGT